MALLKELKLDVYRQNTEGKKIQQLGGNKIKAYSSQIPPLSFIALIDLHLFMKKVTIYNKCVLSLELPHGNACFSLNLRPQLLDSMVRFSADSSKIGPTQIKKNHHRHFIFDKMAISD